MWLQNRRISVQTIKFTEQTPSSSAQEAVHDHVLQNALIMPRQSCFKQGDI